MEHTDNLYNSLNHYFTALEYMGQYDARETENLIIYLFIVNEILDGNLGVHLDDAGLAQIEKVLRCLYNGCLIQPVRSLDRIHEPNPYHTTRIIRLSETFVPRYTEDNDVRLIEDNT